MTFWKLYWLEQIMVFETPIYKNHFKRLQKFTIMVFKDVSVSLNITERY